LSIYEHCEAAWVAAQACAAGR